MNWKWKALIGLFIAAELLRGTVAVIRLWDMVK